MQRKPLARDAGISEHGDGFQALVLGSSTSSRADVDTLMSNAGAAGGRIVIPAGEAGAGYGGLFADPDGVLWNVTAGE